MSGNNTIEMKIALPPDADGFIGFECPTCCGYFKVVGATVSDAGHVTCTYCGHRDESEPFLTKAEVGYIQRVGAGKAVAQLHGQFQDMLTKAFGNSKNVKVTKGPAPTPRSTPRPLERALPSHR